MAEVKKFPSFFHPLITPSPIDSSDTTPKNKNSYRLRNHTVSISSYPLNLTHIFLLSLISFFAVMSILFLISGDDRQYSLLTSLFGADSSSITAILPSHPLVAMKMMSKEEAEFWKQEGRGCKNQRCLCPDFSFRYRKESVRVSKEKRRFLRVVVSSYGDGDIIQLRNRIVDAVLFARILGAALVIPVFKKDSESEFADIFDVEHFKRTLRSDVRVVESHPYTHLTSNQVKEFQLPHHVTPQWMRTKFRKQLNDNGVLVLNGIESKLTGKLPTDLLKLRCKVAFRALRFSDPLREMGYRLAKRIWIEGPYAAFDLGLGHNSQLDAKHQHEHLKTGLVAGDADQQVVEMAKRLKDLGVPRTATLYAATAVEKRFGAAEPETLKPLIAEFPNLVSKETVARPGELSPFVNSSYAMAAIDYIVALNSDVLLAFEDTDLGRALQEHRCYIGKKKVINFRWPEHRRSSNMGSRDANGAYSALACCLCKRALFKLF